MWAKPKTVLEQAGGAAVDPEIAEVIADSIDRLEARLAEVEGGFSQGAP